jgi:hypothetical protein
MLFQPVAMGFSHRQPMDLANLGAFLERASLARQQKEDAALDGA